MSLEYRDEGRGVVFVGTGVVTGAELMAANEEIYSDRRLPWLRYQLVDLTRAVKVDLSADEVRNLALQDSNAARKRRDLIVVVVAGSEFGYGMSRMWAGNVELSGERITPHVARNVEEAEAWLAKMLSDEPSEQQLS